VVGLRAHLVLPARRTAAVRAPGGRGCGHGRISVHRVLGGTMWPYPDSDRRVVQRKPGRMVPSAVSIAERTVS
jgi:hypothetical protein